MTFLELCQQVSDAVGLHGSFTTVATTQTIQRDIAQAVSDAWIDIQKSRESVIFMNKVSNITTTASTSTYDLFTDIVPGGDISNVVDVVYQRRPLKKVLETDIPYISDDTPGKPRWWYVDSSYSNTGDNRSLILNSLNSDTYDLSVIYRKQIQELPLTTVANSYIPKLDEYHHKTIAYKAIMRVAVSLQRIDLYDQYRSAYDEHWGHLMRDQLPKKRMKNRRFI